MYGLHGLHLLWDAADIDACAAHSGGLYHAHLRKAKIENQPSIKGIAWGRTPESACCGEITVGWWHLAKDRPCRLRDI